ncbi:MAG TPA: hypothetical protein VK961_01035 [Chthoniobacter sp.]|nr:hypothetical protein [Chthoniobacter sp.]
MDPKTLEEIKLDLELAQAELQASSDARRLELEEDRNKREKTFFHRNSGPVIAAIVGLITLAGTVFSGVNSARTQKETTERSTQIQKEIADHSAALQKDIADRADGAAEKARLNEERRRNDEVERLAEAERYHRHLEMLNFVEKHPEFYDGTSDAVKRLGNQMVAVFDPQDVTAFLTKVGILNPGAKKGADEAKEQIAKIPLFTAKALVSTLKEMQWKPGEELGFIGDHDLVKSEISKNFLPYQPKGTTGLAARLDPNGQYLALALHNLYPLAVRKNPWIKLRKRGSVGAPIEALVVDRLPESERYGIQMSPALGKALDVQSGDEVEVFSP